MVVLVQADQMVAVGQARAGPQAALAVTGGDALPGEVEVADRTARAVDDETAVEARLLAALPPAVLPEVDQTAVGGEDARGAAGSAVVGAVGDRERVLHTPDDARHRDVELGQ